MRKLIAVAALGALVALPQAAFAGSTSNHSVKIEVPAINEIAVTGVVEIAIDTPTAGSDTVVKTATGGSIAFTTNETKNIHAKLSADLANTAVKLYVKETSADDGTYVDLATGGNVKAIDKAFSAAVPITYKLEAPVAAGTLAETTVTVVYTIQ